MYVYLCTCVNASGITIDGKETRMRNAELNEVIRWVSSLSITRPPLSILYFIRRVLFNGGNQFV